MSEKPIKYLQIADEIKTKILSSVYPPNFLLPSENQLAVEYGVSRITIRAAIQKMIKENYLYTSAGKGTFVKEFSLNKFKTSMKVENILKNGYDEARLLTAGVVHPDINLVYHLQIIPTGKVVALKWLFYKANIPIALNEKYIPYIPGLNIKDKNIHYADFEQILSEETNIYELKTEFTVTGILSDEIINKQLQLDGNKFVVIIERKLMDNDNIPVGYSKFTILSSECLIKGTSFI